MLHVHWSLFLLHFFGSFLVLLTKVCDVIRLKKAKTVARVRRPKTDWPGIRMLYATGVTQDELHKRTGIPLGTICSRSAREGWDADRKRLQELERVQQAKTQELLAAMPERGRRWVSRVAEQTDRHLSVLEAEPIATIKDVDRVIGTLDKVDRVARRSYGLDEEGSGSRTIVNLGFLQDFKPETPVLEAPAQVLTLENT